MTQQAPAPVSIVVTLQDHRHTRESWGVATVLIVEVLAGECPTGVSPGAEVGAVGDRIGLAAPGERLELHGEWDRSKFGLQLRVSEQISQGIKEPHEASRWLTRLDGVGPVLARALASHYGARLPAILSGEEEADLTEVTGIGADTALHIRDSFAALEIAGDLESIRYLDGINATRWEATKIMQWCSKQRRRPLEVLEETPYALMQVKGLGFKKVDRLARLAGCAATAPARLEAATLYQLGEIVDRGSTMTPLFGGRGGGLVGEVSELLGLDKDLARAAAGRLAVGGLVVLAIDEAGKTWVHPAALLRAERSIYRAAKGIVADRSLINLSSAEQEIDADRSATNPSRTEQEIDADRSATNTGLQFGGSPGALPAQAAVECLARQVDDSACFDTANGSECQDGQAGEEGQPYARSNSPVARPSPGKNRITSESQLLRAMEQAMGPLDEEAW